jgi:gluconolactonase
MTDNITRRNLLFGCSTAVASALLHWTTLTTHAQGRGRGTSEQSPPQETGPESERMTTAISGVVADRQRVRRIWMTSDSADGIIVGPDGNLLLCEFTASRIVTIDPQGASTLFMEDTNQAGALAFDAKGQLFSIERGKQQVRMLLPTRKVLSEGLNGMPYMGMRDIVVDRQGGLYVTSGTGQPRPKQSGVYYVTQTGRTTMVVDDVESANAVMLSPDEKVLYVGDGQNEHIVAFDVQGEGRVRNRRNFARMEHDPRTGGDGLAVDNAGRLYWCGRTGVQVFSTQGAYLGTIPTPRSTISVAFAGRDRKTLYIIGRGTDGSQDQQWARTLYSVSMIAEGIKNRTK